MVTGVVEVVVLGVVKVMVEVVAWRGDGDGGGCGLVW